MPQRRNRRGRNTRRNRKKRYPRKQYTCSKSTCDYKFWSRYIGGNPLCPKCLTEQKRRERECKEQELKEQEERQSAISKLDFTEQGRINNISEKINSFIALLPSIFAWYVQTLGLNPIQTTISDLVSQFEKLTDIIGTPNTFFYDIWSNDKRYLINYSKDIYLKHFQSVISKVLKN